MPLSLGITALNNYSCLSTQIDHSPSQNLKIKKLFAHLIINIKKTTDLFLQIVDNISSTIIKGEGPSTKSRAPNRPF